jgi:hypothetical protein
MTEKSDRDAPLSAIHRRYYELREFLGIDTNDLDRAFMHTPRIMQDASELAADANAHENALQHMYEIIKAEASKRIRSVMVAGKEPSEARIVALLPLEPEVQAARTELIEAKRDAHVCSDLHRSFDAQSRLIGKAADMRTTDYIAPSAAYQTRKDIRFARVQAEREEHKIGRPVV